jgi:hypothetical protein
MYKYIAEVKITFLFGDLVDCPVKIEGLPEIMALWICDNKQGDCGPVARHHRCYPRLPEAVDQVERNTRLYRHLRTTEHE